MIRRAKAVWRGTGRDGNGDLSTDSQVLARTPYSYKTRFENEKGTNPEALIAAAHAGCFTMALAFAMQTAGFKPTELATEAAVTLEPDGTQAFKISRSALTLAHRSPETARRRSHASLVMRSGIVLSPRCSRPKLRSTPGSAEASIPWCDRFVLHALIGLRVAIINSTVCCEIDGGRRKFREQFESAVPAS